MVWNCLLDGFPEDYKGYKINTDFRVGILINLLFEDEKIDENAKLLQAFNLLYKEEVPEPDVAYDGLMWFLSCGSSELVYDDETGLDSKSKERLIDYNYDSLDIWGAFWSKGVDLTKTHMHWFKFITALHNLGDCPISQKMEYRSMDLQDMKGEMKKQYSKLKCRVRARHVYTREEAEELIRQREEERAEHEKNLPEFYKKRVAEIRKMGYNF